MPEPESTSPERNDLLVMGHLLGWFDGWEMVDTQTIAFTDFSPSPDYPYLPIGDITIDFEKGTLTYYDDFGKTLRTFGVKGDLHFIQTSNPENPNDPTHR